MKIKSDFVTNSSSASFTISKQYLSELQIAAIKDHLNVADALGIVDYYVSDWDKWKITETDTAIEGFTSMDNFNMREFLNLIGISNGYINYKDDI